MFQDLPKKILVIIGKQIQHSSKKIKVLILSFCVFVGGIYIWNYYSKNALNKPTVQVPVTTISVKKERIELYEDLPGRTVPYEIAEIRPQITGIITERLFQEGAYVKEGQQLYQIDPSAYKAAYNSALAGFTKAKANLTTLKLKKDRYKKAVQVGAVSQQNYDDVVAQFTMAVADVEVAQSALETSKINLAYTKVYAPISGHIGKSEVTKGALVTANQSLAIARITQLDPIYVDISQQSNGQNIQMCDADKVNKNSVTLFLKDKNVPYHHEGRLEFSDVTVDPNTNSVLLRAVFPNPEKILLPGLFIQARVKTKTSDLIRVPQRATIRNADGTISVWIVDKDNKAMPQTIVTEKTSGDCWIVQSGLKEGDIIVFEGFQKLTPHVSVNPTKLAEEKFIHSIKQG